ncbi:MAG: calycin-like domain-containing protein [Muribaculum sp.]|nr:calycin-like domain-containing protein [Muribaculum sp.]
MKKFYTIFGMATVAVLTTVASAQQLPNSNFDGEWNISVPWTSDGNTTEMGANFGQEYEGEPIEFNNVKAYNPASWCISHVIGMNGLGATITGEKIEEGYNGSKSAVKLINVANSIVSTQIVPGYITLGTTWSTSLMGSENDGGSFGSVAFTHKPDAIAFQYKRTHGVADENADEMTQGTYKPEEPATVVAYLWKGEWSQADVPGNIGFISATPCTMVDRDRNILGMATDKGGAVTSTEGSELIASLNYSITGDATDWTYFEQPIAYTSDATPEKINVIISANDYFGGAAAVGRDNSLTIDDIKLVYYSRLNSVKVNGTAVENFDSKTYTYNVAGTCPATESAFELDVLGKSAQTEITIDATNNTATVKVSNVDADSDGLKEHTYTFNFAGEQQSAVKYVGTLTVTFGVDMPFPNSELYITPTGANICTIALYNFNFPGVGNVGDIIVDGVQTTTASDGTITYTGSKEGLSLMEGNMIVNVGVNGTETPEGALTMNIPVEAPVGQVGVVFNGQKDNSGIDAIVNDDNAPVEYFNLNGIRVNGENLAPGIYVKRQGNKVSKILIRK